MSDCVYDPFERFMNAIKHCDTIKVILTGCGESEFTTKEVYESVALRLDSLRNENSDLRNFACQLCGKYKEAHNGACDGCRWRKNEGGC